MKTLLQLSVIYGLNTEAALGANLKNILTGFSG